LVQIHQFIPSYAPRDAIGTHSRHIQRTLREIGIESRIYVGEARGVRPGEVQDYRHFDGAGSSDGVWLLYQLSTGSPMAEFLRTRPEPKMVDYHNITPAALFRAWEPHVGVELEVGRKQMEDLADVTALGLADSAFNESELVAAGYRRTAVLPVLVDLEAFDAEVDGRALDRLMAAKAGGGADFLFVGRVSPNKCQHDLVKALAVYRRVYDPRARLQVVGGSSSHAYWTALERFVGALGLGEAVSLTGSVSPGVLAAHYRAADAFVCLSEHEGFCVPLLEAWHHRLPVVAFAAAAVPETLGPAGVLVPGKAPARVAAAWHRVVSDPQVRAALVAAGEARLAEFSLDRSRARLVTAVEDLLAETG
jgi:glycosyltransferase involved in cell wall biosynthesis